MEKHEQTYKEWLKNLIDKKVNFLGKDDYASYYNIFFNNEVIQIIYDGEIVCNAIYLCRNIQHNSETLIYDNGLKVRSTKVSLKKISQINDLIKKYIIQNSLNQ